MWHAMQLPSKSTDYTANENMLHPALLLASALQHIFQIQILTGWPWLPRGQSLPRHYMLSLWDLASSTHLDMELKRLVVMLTSRGFRFCLWLPMAIYHPPTHLTHFCILVSTHSFAFCLHLCMTICCFFLVSIFLNIRIIASATALTWALVAVALPLDEGLHCHCPRPEASPAFATQAGLPGHLGSALLQAEASSTAKSSSL